MGAYLLRRFGLMLLTLFGISVIIFTLLRVVPGNIVDILFDSAGMVDPAEKARISRMTRSDSNASRTDSAQAGQKPPVTAPIRVVSPL